MEIVNLAIEKYCEDSTSTESEILKKLNRETHSKILQPRMLSGHLQGRFLAMLSQMIQPTFILEIGTYTGYSALCLAEGLQENGKIITIDVNEELEEFTRNFFEASSLINKIEYIIADAKEIIPNLEHEFDIVFIDADKKNYLNYYNLVFDKVKKGGYIISDNVLWSGKVADEKCNDKDTVNLREFNKLMLEDPRTENILLPIRDGLMLSRKI